MTGRCDDDLSSLRDRQMSAARIRSLCLECTAQVWPNYCRECDEHLRNGHWPVCPHYSPHSGTGGIDRCPFFAPRARYFSLGRGACSLCRGARPTSRRIPPDSCRWSTPIGWSWRPSRRSSSTVATLEILPCSPTRCREVAVRPTVPAGSLRDRRRRRARCG